VKRIKERGNVFRILKGNSCVALDAAAYPADVRGCNWRRSGAKKSIEHQLAAVGEVGQCVLEHGSWFQRRMTLSAPRASDPSEGAE
jgi:hypothetical protein